MKAIVRTKAGKDFSTMQVTDLSLPTPRPGQLTIKMAASRINPVDSDLMKGFPGLTYKKPQIGGVDGAGTITALGEGVTRFKEGDTVFFYRSFADLGTWAEEITINAGDVATIPAHLTPEEAGGIALPLLTAYEGIQSLDPQPGQRILVQGAGGGVGFMAVQVAKALGLEVIANASGRDQGLLAEVGVDQFINYKKAHFATVLKDQPPDLVFDVLGKKALLEALALSPQKVVSVAYPDTSKMHKTGVKLPGILIWLMKSMNAKFRKAARKHGVQLLGQVTGNNGSLLQSASDLATKHQFITKPSPTLTLEQIVANGMDKSAVGKVLHF